MKLTWVYRHFGHYLAGGVAAWIGMDNPILALALVLSFFLYEIWQGYRKKDMGYWDMLEFVVTFFVVATGLQIWQTVS